VTDIEWTDKVWNPVLGCSRVSAGCENCYAERFAHRGLQERHRGLTVAGPKGPRWNGTVRLVPEVLDTPLRRRKPTRYFVNSMSDLFHEDVPFEFVASVFGVMAAAPQHTFQVLTKRPRRMLEFFDWAEKHGDGYDLLRCGIPSGLLACAWEAVAGDEVGDVPPFDDLSPSPETFGTSWPLPNVWLGVSVENQAAADERVPLLQQCPAAVRWLSVEPLLGPIDFEPIPRAIFDRKAAIRRCMYGPVAMNEDQADSVIAHPEIDWVVVGGESGPGARPCDLTAVRGVVLQCQRAGVPVFVKQLGANPRFIVPGGASLNLKSRKGADMAEWPEDLRIREFPKTEATHG
jgi:protein gp37